MRQDLREEDFLCRPQPLVVVAGDPVRVLLCGRDRGHGEHLELQLWKGQELREREPRCVDRGPIRGVLRLVFPSTRFSLLSEILRVNPFHFQGLPLLSFGFSVYHVLLLAG